MKRARKTKHGRRKFSTIALKSLAPDLRLDHKPTPPTSLFQDEKLPRTIEPKMRRPTILLLATAKHALAACECGYTVNSTTSALYALYTDLFETDFLHIPAATWNSTHNIGWQPQAYNVTSANSQGPYGKAARLENVVANPIADQWDWSGEGVLGGDPGLQLWVRSQLVEGLVPMGEVDGLRDDLLHGSFRVGMKTASVEGTCGAFFWVSDPYELALPLCGIFLESMGG